jgi:hypothetical protein
MSTAGRSLIPNRKRHFQHVLCLDRVIGIFLHKLAMLGARSLSQGRTHSPVPSTSDTFLEIPRRISAKVRILMQVSYFDMSAELRSKSEFRSKSAISGASYRPNHPERSRITHRHRKPDSVRTSETGIDPQPSCPRCSQNALKKESILIMVN